MQAEWMKARETRYGAYLVTYLIVVILALGAVNWLANRHNTSFDATSNKRFSLSDQTIKIVKGTRPPSSPGPVICWIATTISPPN